MPSYPALPRIPSSVVTVGGQSGVTWMTPPHFGRSAGANDALDRSCVKSSVWVNGFQVDPSIDPKPVWHVTGSAGGINVIRCAGLVTSRLMRVMYAKGDPFSCP